MSCSVPVFACIQDVNRVISILNDAPISGEQDVKETNGECLFSLFCGLFGTNYELMSNLNL